MLSLHAGKQAIWLRITQAKFKKTIGFQTVMRKEVFRKINFPRFESQRKTFNIINVY